MKQEIKQKCVDQKDNIKKFYDMSMGPMKQHISELQEFEKLVVNEGTIEDIKQAHNRKRDQDNIGDFQKEMRICKECNEIYDDINSKILNIKHYDEEVRNLDDDFRAITPRITAIKLSLEEGDYSKIELKAVERLKEDLEDIQGRVNDMLQKGENLPS